MESEVQQPTKYPVPVNSCDSILACLGEGAVAYAKNKQRGGNAGKKGSQYEDLFIACKVAEIANLRLDGKLVSWPFLGGQVTGFVDDALISSSESTDYYQLKNVSQITWLAGGHPIATDFAHQYTLACHECQPNPTTTLVVPDRTLEAQLRQTLPPDIAGHSSVVYFPYSDSLNRFVLENDIFHPALRSLSKLTDPSKDELAGVLGVIMIGCRNHPNGALVDDILRSAHSCVPNLLRVSGFIVEPVALRTPFVKILAGIAGLTYDVSKGFFSWSGFGTTGVLGFSCLDQQFVRFQENVEHVQPTTFEGFEELLP